MAKFFIKSKKSCFGVILGPFCPTSVKNKFSWTNGLCQFLDIPIIYQRAYNHEKLLSHFLKKRRTDGRTEGQTVRQQ